MDALAILIGFIALLLALNARKAVKALVLQLAGHAARVRGVEEELESAAAASPAARCAAPGPGRGPRGCGSRSARGPPAETPQPAGSSERRAPVRSCCRGPRAGRDLPGRAARHTLGRLGRRPGAGARRPAAGALFDRAGRFRAGRARGARRALRACPRCRRRMVPPHRAPAAGRGHSRRPRAEHPHRRRHGQRLRHRLCRPCALRLHRSGRRLRPPRPHRRRHHARCRAAWAGAGGPRSRRLAGRAAARVVRRAQSLAARDLSRRCRRGGLCAGPAAPLAVARLGRGRRRVRLGCRPARASRQPRRRLVVRPVRARRPAAGAGRRLHGARAASCHARPRSHARLDRDGGLGGPVGAGDLWRWRRPLRCAMDPVRRRRHGASWR